MEYVWVLAIVLGPWSNRDAMTNAAILDLQLTAFWRHLCGGGRQFPAKANGPMRRSSAV